MLTAADGPELWLTGRFRLAFLLASSPLASETQAASSIRVSALRWGYNGSDAPHLADDAVALGVVDEGGRGVLMM